MRSLGLAQPGRQLSVLCLGAHSDDIEIGAGGMLMSLIAMDVRVTAHWCVLSAPGARADEAGRSAQAFMQGAAGLETELLDFEDGLFPQQVREIKAWMQDLKRRVQPDLVLTHRRHDAHQDHREVCGLTWNVFRDHLILEYEIPKWDGDLGQPNSYWPLSQAITARKCELLMAHFGTQRGKDWFDQETFSGLARLRGMECRAPERYAEGFFLRKALLA